MALQIWESCVYTAEEERDFLRDHLGPVMEKKGLGDKNIIMEIKYNFIVGSAETKLVIPAHSMQTLVY